MDSRVLKKISHLKNLIKKKEKKGKRRGNKTAMNPDKRVSSGARHIDFRSPQRQHGMNQMRDKRLGDSLFLLVRVH